MTLPVKREAIQINGVTWQKIIDRFPQIARNYTRAETLELITKREILVTNERQWYDFMILTEQDFLQNYGTASPDIQVKFVPVVKVL